MIRFRQPATPQASVIIPAYRRSDRLSLCLDALARHTGSGLAFEVVVVLNQATAAIRRFLHASVEGATIVVSDVNIGFGGACNLGRQYARAPYLILLNDDAEIEPCCLDHLVETAEAMPDAGVVGTAVLFPNGQLQEAGSLIWADGITSAIGRGEPTLGWEHDFLREVDYCSGCSLLVRAQTWDAVGGMDEDYYPGYYEDCDLCMRVRQIGQRVMYTPSARVRHHEGSSSDGHFRTFLIRRNAKRFATVWKMDLAVREPAAPHDRAATERAMHRARRFPRRLLIVDDRLPEESAGSGFARMWEVIRALSIDYAISCWCSNGKSSTTNRLRQYGVRVVGEPLDEHLSRPETLYDVVLVSRPHNFARYGALIHRWQPVAAVVYRLGGALPPADGWSCESGSGR